MEKQQTDNFIKVAGVRFRENWKVYDFDDAGVNVAVGDKVIVDSDRGLGFGQVVRVKKIEAAAVATLPTTGPEGLEVETDVEEIKGSADTRSEKGQTPKTLRRILRKATADDVAHEEANRTHEDEAFAIAQEMIAERELTMKLIRVEYSFDASRAVFYFFSETRVDFRELVKELAHKLKSRIEMRQIGVRDVARLIGGFGSCGRELCCASFLKNFEPVSIRMAKKQEMVLNPAKISGVCGRLLCCLSYEYEMYDEIKKDLADMREAVAKDKKEEANRIEEERSAAEERRLAEEKKRQRDRRQEKPKEAGQKIVGKAETRKAFPQEVKPQPSPEQLKDMQHQTIEKEPSLQAQGTQLPQQNGEKSSKKKRRRFWRKKKKNQQQGDSKPPEPEKT